MLLGICTRSMWQENITYLLSARMLLNYAVAHPPSPSLKVSRKRPHTQRVRSDGLRQVLALTTYLDVLTLSC